MENTIKLSDGRNFPVVGLGTFRVNKLFSINLIEL